MESDIPSDDEGDLRDEMVVALPVSQRWSESSEAVLLSRKVVAERGDSGVGTENTVPEGMAYRFVRKNDGFSGSSGSDQKLNVKVSQELKDLGTKARARLEEERMKRPEIQRLDQIPMVDPLTIGRTKKTSFSTKIAAQSVAAAPVSRKRRIPKMSSQSSSRTRTGALWIPDVSHINIPEREGLSTTVRLHGLPANCAIEHVNKFFTGLAPESVSILLPNHTHIELLDAMDESDYKDTLESHRVRAVADFPSAAAAVLAAERSGETIRMLRSDRQEEQNYVVMVTVLDKKMAEALASMKVPAVPRATFAATLIDVVEKQLHPMVPVILWSMAASRKSKNLLAVDDRIAKAGVLLTQTDEDMLWDVATIMSWGSHPGYRRCIDHYNNLVDIQDELLHHIPFPTVEMRSLSASSLEGHPTVLLSTCACRALAEEIDRLEALLYRARTFKNL